MTASRSKSISIRRTTPSSSLRGWDCSQFGNEEEGKKKSGEKKARWELQRAEDEKLEEILEQRRKEGNALKVDVMQKAPELVVHEGMTQGEKVTGAKVKKKVKGMVHWRK